MSFSQRIRAIVRAIREARIPPPPKRRYDLIGEAAARPFGETGGRGPGRAGGGNGDDEDPRPASR